jgi:hypothetical protein
VSDSLNELELLEQLTWVLGDRVEAARMLASALEASGRTRVPPEPTKLIAFVRAHLLERVSAVVGPATSMVFLEDLRDKFGVRRTGDQARISETARPSATASGIKERLAEILIVDRDRFARSALARLLCQSGTRVVGYDEFGEVTPAVSYAAVVAAIRNREELVGLARLLEETSCPCILVLADDAREAELATRAIMAQILPLDTPAAAVCAVVLEALGVTLAEAK